MWQTAMEYEFEADRQIAKEEAERDRVHYKELREQKAEWRETLKTKKGWLRRTWF